MSPLQIREAVKQVYPYKTWYERVNKMTEAQVVALYMRFKAQGKL